MSCLPYCAIAIALTLFTTSDSLASPDDAAESYAEGLRLYVEKDYAGAAKALKQSYDSENNQDTLFAWAQAERLLGNCKRSRKLFTDYIANGANANQKRAAFGLMEDCDERDLKLPDTEPNTKPTDSTTAPIGDPSPNPIITDQTNQSEATDSWYQDWIGMSLVTTGVAGLVVSGISYQTARTIESDAEGTDYDTFVGLKGKAESRRTISAVSGILGGILLGSGVAYYLFLSPDNAEIESGLSLDVNQDSAALSFSSVF